MKYKIQRTITEEVDIKYVRMNLPVWYEDEDIPYDFPFREGELLKLVVEIETGRIPTWPKGKSYDVYMKVCDGGRYALLNQDGSSIAYIINGYVPNKLIPGEYGDYVDLQIDENGIITNWPKRPDVSEFFKVQD